MPSESQLSAILHSWTLKWVQPGAWECVIGCFCIHCEKWKVSCLTRTNPRSSITFFSIFLLVGQHCFVNSWHLHIHRCCHYQPHSSRLGIMSNYFSWGGCNNGNSNEGRTLLWLLPNRHDFSFFHRGFWVFSSIVQ